MQATGCGGSQGYSLAGADGGVFSFGGDPYYGSLPGERITPASPIVGIASSSLFGYWLAGADGGVFSLGACTPFYGSMAGHRLAAPIVGIASSGDGYWLVGADGGVFSFGGAHYFGSLPAMGIKPSTPIVGIAPTSDGDGYWLVDAAGGVFSFGDAAFFGSLPSEHVVPKEAVVGIAADPDGHGYWLAGADGGVFSFGEPFFGSLPATGITPSAAIVGIAPAQVYTCSASSPVAGGYWLVGADGGVFSFGSATFEGSEGGSRLARPIVGIASSQGLPPLCPPGPGQITDEVELSASQVVAGQSLQATFVIHNSGSPINLTQLATSEVHEPNGQVLAQPTGCAPKFAVDLIGADAQQDTAFPSDCSTGAFIIPSGTTQLPFTVQTYYSGCLQDGGQPTETFPDCDNGVPPLPPGQYTTQVVWSATVPVPSPQPVTVTILAP